MKIITFILCFLLLGSYMPTIRYSYRFSDIPGKFTDHQWISDLDSMYGFMKKTHPGLYWKTSQTEFENLIIKFKSEIPHLTDNQITTKLSRLAALARDGHTVLMGSNISDKYFPVRIESLSDGYFITSVSDKYSGIYGLKVVTIGNCRIEEAFRLIRSVTSSDNSYSELYWTARNLTMSSMLNGLGIIDSPDLLPLEIIDHKNEKKRVTIKAESYPFIEDDFHSWFWQANAVPATNYINLLTETADNPPLRLKNYSKPYWFEFIEEKKSIYFCFNSCENSANDPFAEFNDRLWAVVETKKPGKLIIDLRNNIGGTNDHLQPLIQGIIRHDEINKKGHLFVLTGRKTFSAAVHCATWIERNSQPVFAGEPTGAGPNHYGDPSIYTLPNSKLLLLVSTVFWQNGQPWDKREWIEPEIKIEVDSKQYFSGKDPVLDKVLN